MRERAGAGDEQARQAIAALERERAQKAAKIERGERELAQARQQVQQARSRAETLERGLKTREREIASLQERVAQAQAAERDRASRPAARAVPVDPAGPNVVRDIRLETDGAPRASSSSSSAPASSRPCRAETAARS